MESDSFMILQHNETTPVVSVQTLDLPDAQQMDVSEVLGDFNHLLPERCQFVMFLSGC